MRQFWKRPKFWIILVLVLWAAYIIYENFQLAPVPIHVIPLVATLEVRVSAIVIGSVIFGVVATLVVQYLWRRRSSKIASVSAAAAGPSSSTTL